jgi:hypothetical protein
MSSDSLIFRRGVTLRFGALKKPLVSETYWFQRTYKTEMELVPSNSSSVSLFKKHIQHTRIPAIPNSTTKAPRDSGFTHEMHEKISNE